MNRKQRRQIKKHKNRKNSNNHNTNRTSSEMMFEALVNRELMYAAIEMHANSTFETNNTQEYRNFLYLNAVKKVGRYFPSKEIAYKKLIDATNLMEDE